MGFRVHHHEDKLKCFMTLKIPVDISLSISLSERMADRFRLIVSNEDNDYSKVMRHIIFKKMGVKDKRDFDCMMEKQIDNMRELIYEKMGVDKRTRMWFSTIMANEIDKYVEKNQDA